MSRCKLTKHNLSIILLNINNRNTLSHNTNKINIRHNNTTLNLGGGNFRGQGKVQQGGGGFGRGRGQVICYNCGQPLNFSWDFASPANTCLYLQKIVSTPDSLFCKFCKSVEHGEKDCRAFQLLQGKTVDTYLMKNDEQTQVEWAQAQYHPAQYPLTQFQKPQYPQPQYQPN